MIDVEAIRREEFPITRRGVYLDNATFGPPPARHVRAVTAFLERMSAEGLDDLFAISDEGVDAVRAKAATLLNARPSNVFFVRSTSHGVGVVAEGLSWREGDEVILYELDHPAGVFPWLNLAGNLRKQGELKLAAEAFSSAFAAEPTNAQILWDRAQNLRQLGKQQEATALVRRIAEGSWQPRFSGLQAQARHLLKGE